MSGEPTRAQTAPAPARSELSTARSRLQTSQGGRARGQVNSRRKKARDLAHKKWMDRYKNFPGEFQYEDYNDQEGMGEGYVSWSWNKEMRRVHVGLIRNAKSYVVEEVQKHEVLADKLAIMFDTTEARERNKILWERKLKRENLHMVHNIAKMQDEVTDIGQCLDPTWRAKQVEKALEHTKHLRIARQVDLDVVNRDNQQLLHFLKNAKPNYSNKNQKEHWKRHCRLRKAMRKVADYVPKKRSRKPIRSALDVSDAEFTLDNQTPRLLQSNIGGKRSRRTPKVKTRGEAVLANMYDHAFRNAGTNRATPVELVARVTTPSTLQARNRQQEGTLSRRHQEHQKGALGALGISAFSTAMLPGTTEYSEVLDGHYDVGDEQNLLMMATKLNLGSRDTLVSIFRTENHGGDLKFKCVDIRSGVIRAVYISANEIRELCQRNAVLFNSGKGGNRFQRIALLLDLDGAFDAPLTAFAPN